jgi:thiol:disulfide interchange protein DsbD
MMIAVVAAAMGSIVYRDGPPAGEKSDAKNLIPWRTDLESARREAIAADKPLFIEFSAGWCPDCREMETQTWSDAHVAEAMKAFVPVQIDFDSQADLVKQFEVKSIPTLLIVDPRSGNIMQQSRANVLLPDRFLAWLK